MKKGYSYDSSNPKEMKKSRHVFTREEDQQLIFLVSSFGENRWNKIANILRPRTARQCKDRWTMYLSPAVNKNPWSELEDKLLIEKVKEIGPKWTKLAKFFPGRTDNSIKNHWNMLLRKKPEKINKQISSRSTCAISNKNKNKCHNNTNIMIGIHEASSKKSDVTKGAKHSRDAKSSVSETSPTENTDTLISTLEKPILSAIDIAESSADKVLSFKTVPSIIYGNNCTNHINNSLINTPSSFDCNSNINFAYNDNLIIDININRNVVADDNIRKSSIIEAHTNNIIPVESTYNIISNQNNQNINCLNDNNISDKSTETPIEDPLYHLSISSLMNRPKT